MQAEKDAVRLGWVFRMQNTKFKPLEAVAEFRRELLAKNLKDICYQVSV